jgi:hypothetical protein
MLYILKKATVLISLVFLSNSFLINELYWIGLFLCLPVVFIRANNDIFIMIKLMFMVLLLTYPLVIFNSLYNDSILSMSYWVALMLSIILAYNLSQISKLPISISVAPYLITVVVFSFLLVSGVSVTAWLPNNSENFIPVSLYLGYASFLFLSKRTFIGKVDVAISIPILFFSIVSGGRSGIICSFIIFIFVNFIFFRSILESKRPLVKNITYFLFFVFIPFFIYSFSIYLVENNLISRLVEKGLESNARISIILDYFRYITKDFLYIIVGYPADKIEELRRFGYNLHNSYLNMHSLFGLGYLLFFFVISIFSVFRVFKYKQLMPFFPILVAIYVRAAIDIQIFAGRLDWIVYGLWFMGLRLRSEVYTQHKEYRYHQ